MDRKGHTWFSGWLVTKGSDTSGNWMHKGVKGRRGGSAPGGGHGRLGVGPGWLKSDIKDTIDKHRAEMAAKKKAPKAAGTAPTDYNFDEWATDESQKDKRAQSYLSRGLDQSSQSFASSDQYLSWVQGTAVLLAKETGLDSKDVTRQVAQWASTSNDTNLRALSMQVAISQELDVPLSTWQIKQMQKAIQQFPNKTAYEKQNERALFQPQESKLLARTIYDRTQKDLAVSGYKPGDTIRLFRGVKHAEQAKKGDVADLTQNAASSWSLDLETAWNFGYSGEKKTGRVIAMDVPIESIFSTARTGFGTLRENEFVVLGIPGAQALVVQET